MVSAGNVADKASLTAFYRRPLQSGVTISQRSWPCSHRPAQLLQIRLPQQSPAQPALDTFGKGRMDNLLKAHINKARFYVRLF